MHAARRALSALEGLFSSAQIMTWLRRSAYAVTSATGRPVQCAPTPRHRVQGVAAAPVRTGATPPPPPPALLQTPAQACLARPLPACSQVVPRFVRHTAVATGCVMSDWALCRLLRLAAWCRVRSAQQ